MPLRPLRALLPLLLAAPLAAQDPAAAQNIAKAKAALAPVASMIGTWDGDATVMTGPGQTLAVKQHEDIVAGAMGTVIMIRGTGRDPQTGAINFEAAGTVWFDVEAGKLRMRTFNNGRSIEPDVEIRPDTIVWGFAVPGGRIRYTIALTADTWHEIGEFIREGAAPIKTIDMRLRRTSR